MENIVSFLLPLFLAAVAVKLLITPIRLAWKLGLHVSFGFTCLWILNSTAGFTGVTLPINAITALVAGIGGMPGLGLIALLELM